MKIFGLTTSGIEVASRSLDFIADSTTNSSANISNATTPNYKAVSSEFEDVMARALKTKNEGGMEKTDPRHFPVSELSRLHPVRAVESEAGSLDGNTVDMEKEMTKLGEMNIKYSAFTTIASREIGTLKSAISLNVQG